MMVDPARVFAFVYPGRRIRHALLVGLLAFAVTAPGMWQIPMEEHEIFVAQTAENMVKSGDYVVPRINGDYRLNKPPVSYWAVAAVTQLVGHREVSPWLARSPSVLAAIALSLLTLGIGTRLFDRRTGLMAAVMVASCVATFKYGHNARPDMLYAALCTAMLYCWIRAKNPQQSHSPAWIYGLWIVAGMATLTKGPQAPTVVVLGLMVHEWRQTGRFPESLKVFRIPSGLLLATCIAAPWWWLLKQQVGASVLEDSQLSGSLLRLSYEGITSGYYLLRGPALWLPWTLLIPGAWLLVRRSPKGAPAMLLTLVGTAMLVFSFGSQVRHIYMLPWIAPAMLLLAAGVSAEKHCRVPLWAVWLTILCAFAWLLWHAPAMYSVPTVLLATPLLLASANKLDQYGSNRAVVYAGIALSLGLAAAGMSPALWSTERYEEAQLAEFLNQSLPHDMQLAVVEREASLYSYHVGREVEQLNDLPELCDWLNGGHGETAIVLPATLESGFAGLGLHNEQPVKQPGGPLFNVRLLPSDARCMSDAS